MFRPSTLRLTMSPSAGHGAVDGAWWPHSRDLQTEVADLVEHLPRQLGHVVHVVYSRPDWDTAPRRIRLDQGYVKTGSYPRDDTAVLMLGLSSRQVLQLLVVPPSSSPTAAERVMRRAADPRDTSTTRELRAAGAEGKD